MTISPPCMTSQQVDFDVIVSIFFCAARCEENKLVPRLGTNNTSVMVASSDLSPKFTLMLMLPTPITYSTIPPTPSTVFFS
jgi:hypothetical protein